MHVIVVGCGRVGSELAYRLFSAGHEVAVVDEVAEAFKKLPPGFRGRTVLGEVLAREVLRRADIERTDAIAAVTSSDTLNAVVGHAARKIYRVATVVVRNYDPRFLAIHKAFGHDAVSSTVWGAERLQGLIDPGSVSLREGSERSVVSAVPPRPEPAFRERGRLSVLIAGGGRTASELATILVAQGHGVQLVENRQDVLGYLHRELPTEAIYEGYPGDIDVLSSAGIMRASVLVACMPKDQDNLALSFVARERFRVPRIIACINQPANDWLYGKEIFHVDVALNQAEILAALIEEEMSLGQMMTLLKIRGGRYSLVNETLPEGAVAVGSALSELALPPETVIAAILRRGEMVIPRGSVRLQAGDEVLAIASPDAAEELARLLGAAPSETIPRSSSARAVPGPSS
jgi:trk system potassium uptake protein TrkA